MEDYYRAKIENNLIFTRRNINPSAEPFAMVEGVKTPNPICCYTGPNYWSRLSGRYRTRQEQVEFINRGCVDVKLGALQ